MEEVTRDGENCIMRRFIIFTLRQTLLVQPNREEVR